MLTLIMDLSLIDSLLNLINVSLETPQSFISFLMTEGSKPVIETTTKTTENSSDGVTKGDYIIGVTLVCVGCLFAGYKIYDFFSKKTEPLTNLYVDDAVVTNDDTP